MTVKELISRLETFDPNLPVAIYVEKWEEYCDINELNGALLSPPDSYGWRNRNSSELTPVLVIM